MLQYKWTERRKRISLLFCQPHLQLDINSIVAMERSPPQVFTKNICGWLATYFYRLEFRNTLAPNINSHTSFLRERELQMSSHVTKKTTIVFIKLIILNKSVFLG